jgi:hypothetical protein
MRGNSDVQSKQPSKRSLEQFQKSKNMLASLQSAGHLLSENTKQADLNIKAVRFCMQQ